MCVLPDPAILRCALNLHLVLCNVIHRGPFNVGEPSFPTLQAVDPVSLLSAIDSRVTVIYGLATLFGAPPHLAECAQYRQHRAAPVQGVPVMLEEVQDLQQDAHAGASSHRALRRLLWEEGNGVLSLPVDSLLMWATASPS